MEKFHQLWKEDGRWMWITGIAYNVGTRDEYDEDVDGGIEATKKEAQKLIRQSLKKIKLSN